MKYQVVMGISGPEWDNFQYCCAVHYSPDDINDNPTRKRLKRGSIPQFFSVQFIDPPEEAEDERHLVEEEPSQEQNPDEDIQYSQVIINKELRNIIKIDKNYHLTILFITRTSFWPFQKNYTAEIYMAFIICMIV